MPNYVNAIIGICSIFLATTLGACFVFLFKKDKMSNKVNQIFIGFAAGVMLSASFFSLILPALEYQTSVPAWLIVGVSLICGAVFLWGIDKITPHIHRDNHVEGIKKTKLSKNSKMFLAVTIHNIPEGLSVGIAFGVALANLNNPQLLIGALLLAIGISIQNIPEGLVVALPIKAETGSSRKAFVFGTLSGIVEPIAAVIGLILALSIQSIMPFALAFAAGCMIYVVAEEMIPDMKAEDNNHYGVWAFIIGFVIMMILDSIQF